MLRNFYNIATTLRKTHKYNIKLATLLNLPYFRNVFQKGALLNRDLQLYLIKCRWIKKRCLFPIQKLIISLLAKYNSADASNIVGHLSHHDLF